MNIKDQIDKIVSKYEEDGDIPLSAIDDEANEAFSDKLAKIFNSHNISKYKTSFDKMFDSCGFDCWSYSIAWIDYHIHIEICITIFQSIIYHLLMEK